MKVSRLAATSDALRRTSSRKEKAQILAEMLTELASDEIEPAVGFMLAKPRQGAIGVGWAAVTAVSVENLAADPSDDAPDVVDFDHLLSRLQKTTGTGSEAMRQAQLDDFLSRCAQPAAGFVCQVLLGESRQGALAGVLTEAVAKASGVPITTLRRAVMLTGNLGHAAKLALTEGEQAIAKVDLEVGRPIEPMLASTAATTADALEKMSFSSVEWKLDGARIQVHISDDDSKTSATEVARQVTVYTRNLNEISARLPEVVRVALSLKCSSAVLDGEVLGFFGPSKDVSDERPAPFQDTMSSFGQHDNESGHTLQPFFFDLMFLNGTSLIDKPLTERRAALEKLARGHVIPQMTIEHDDDLADAVKQADEFLKTAIDNGHEGIMIKAGDSLYQAGRRGKTWRKVKPVHTLDLVVLGAEWGHGRRQGWLSNLHLGARDSSKGEFVMVGKTFKGLTDKLLAWQTEQFLDLKTTESNDGHTVFVRPELVVEIAVDGAQSSRRYPGGVALRFARVRAYRPDRDAASVNTIEDIAALL